MNTLKTKQLNAELTGMVDGQKTWSRQAWEQGRKSDLSMEDLMAGMEKKLKQDKKDTKMYGRPKKKGELGV